MAITKAKMRLVGEDGNAYAILLRARQALRRAGRADLLDAYTKEATSGDYNNLLAVTMKYVECDEEAGFGADDEEEEG